MTIEIRSECQQCGRMMMAGNEDDVPVCPAHVPASVLPVAYVRDPGAWRRKFISAAATLLLVSGILGCFVGGAIGCFEAVRNHTYKDRDVHACAFAVVYVLDQCLRTSQSMAQCETRLENALETEPCPGP